jgi:hypothetical protein
MMRLFACLLLISNAVAFSALNHPRWGLGSHSSVTTPPKFMTASADEKDEAPIMSALEVDNAPIDVEVPMSVVKNMNTGEIREVKWVDPAMKANTNPFRLEWWGYIFILPFILLADDLLHFLPTEGPLSILKKL